MQSTKIDSQQLMQFSTMFDVGSFERILGDKYDVYDYADIFNNVFYRDFTTGNQLTNMGYVKSVSGFSSNSQSFPNYVGRGSIVHIIGADDVNLQIFSGIADDTDRYRSAFGVGGNICLGGVWDAVAYDYMLYEVSSNEAFFFLPFGASLTFTGLGGSAIIIERGVFNYCHDAGVGTADFECGITAWDGSYYFMDVVPFWKTAFPVTSFISLGDAVSYNRGFDGTISDYPQSYGVLFTGLFIERTKPAYKISSVIYGKRFVPKSPPQNDFSVPWLEIL